MLRTSVTYLDRGGRREARDLWQRARFLEDVGRRVGWRAVSSPPRGPADEWSRHLPLGGDALGIPEPAAVLVWWRGKHTEAECDLKYEQGHITKERVVLCK